MHADADEVGERLSGIRGDLLCLRGAGAEHRRDVGLNILKDRVGGGDGSEIAAGPRERHPGGRGVLAIGGQHVELRVCRRRGGGVEQRIGPVRERNAQAGSAVGLEVAEAVGDGHAVAVAVHTGDGGEDVGGCVRDKRRVVVREQSSVPANEIQQVRHLLQVGRDVRIVAREMRVIELHVDHVLDSRTVRVQRTHGSRSGYRSRQQQAEEAIHKTRESHTT